MKTAVLFAGQGSQTVGMGKDLYDNYEEFRRVFDLLTPEEQQIAWNGPEEQLSDTAYTQPILLAFGAGVYEILHKDGWTPDLGAGLSLGEYTALTAAQVLTPKDGVELVRFRAEEMKKAAAGIEPEMVAIMGLDADRVKECCLQAGESEGVSGVAEITNLNCPGQIIVSGEAGAVQRAAELAQEKGARRCMKLNVSGPFHTSYMEPVGNALRERFGYVDWNEPVFTLMYNFIGDEKSEGDAIPELLVNQVSNGVKMEAIIRNMLAAGVERIIEIGPGSTLAGFVRKIDRKAECISISSCEDVEKVRALLKEEA